MGSELNYGMCGLGTPQVHCLTSRQWASEQTSSGCKGECNHRAKTVAKAFGKETNGNGVCMEEPPLGEPLARNDVGSLPASCDDGEDSLPAVGRMMLDP